MRVAAIIRPRSGPFKTDAGDPVRGRKKGLARSTAWRKQSEGSVGGVVQ